MARNASAATAAPSPVDIAAVAAETDISRPQRVYVDIAPRVPSASGALATVQREQRLGDAPDAPSGAFQLARIKKGRDGDELVTRYPLTDVQELVTALHGAGVIVVKA